MSSLQKFHRRTNGGAPAVKPVGSEAAIVGSGFYLGFAGDGTSYMYVDPTGAYGLQYGSNTVFRGTISTTNGIANTNTLYSFGSAAHPAAYYCKTLTTGGYNTWYMPAINELRMLYTCRNATPFSTNNGFPGSYHNSSTENPGEVHGCYIVHFGLGIGNDIYTKARSNLYTRAVRRALI
jgi:hypothetical protein